MQEAKKHIKHFRKTHITPKKMLFSIGMGLIFGLAYLNVVLIQDYESLKHSKRDVNAQGTFNISEDEAKGKITVENENIKAVWNYKILPEEYNNRGGGNIYELYDKRTDSQSALNLVGVNNYGGAGTHNALTGIGGLGVTGLYDNLGKPLTGDNGSYARLVSKDYQVEGDKVIVKFEYIVKSNTVKDGSGKLLDDYLLIKEWDFSKDIVTLHAKATMLRDARVSEPRISFNFKRDYWEKAEIFGHDMLWPKQDCQGPNTDGFGNPKNTTTTWDLNDSTQNDKCYSTRHAEKLTLDGKRSNVVLTIENGGRGFESGGMFNYGYNLWGTKDNNMATEFVLGVCGRGTVDPNFPDSSEVPGAIDLHWFPWWGGSPPADTRYKDVKSGDVLIDDTFKIEVTSARQAQVLDSGNNQNSSTSVPNTESSSVTTEKAIPSSATNPNITENITRENQESINILQDPGAVLGDITEKTQEDIQNFIKPEEDENMVVSFVKKYFLSWLVFPVILLKNLVFGIIP
jgi:hypothetical protein